MLCVPLNGLISSYRTANRDNIRVSISQGQRTDSPSHRLDEELIPISGVLDVEHTSVDNVDILANSIRQLYPMSTWSQPRSIPIQQCRHLL